MSSSQPDLQIQQNPGKLSGYQQIDSKAYMERQMTQVAYIILKKNETRGLPLFNFRTYYKATVKSMNAILKWYCDIGERINNCQWKRTESPEFNIITVNWSLTKE